MAQTPQAGTAGSEETVPPDSNASPGALGNPTTLILLAVAAIFLFWNMRRRRAMEERLQTQRREERMAEAQRSARDVAHVMRAASPAAAAAAAEEGLASAARMPATAPRNPDDGSDATGAAAVRSQTEDETRARAMERAESAAAADRAAVERAQRLAQEAETGGKSDARRMAAGAAAAEEVRVDSVEALRAQSREAPAGGAAESTVPPGAVDGDGTASCPPGFPVKGNASSRIYHEPGQSSYPPTIAEFCFASAEAAQAAGFRQSRARGLRDQK